MVGGSSSLIIVSVSVTCRKSLFMFCYSYEFQYISHPQPFPIFHFCKTEQWCVLWTKKNSKENKINSIATYLSPLNSYISCRTCSWGSILLFCGNPLYINPTSYLVYMFVPWIKFKYNVRSILHFDFKLYGQLKTRMMILKMICV